MKKQKQAAMNFQTAMIQLPLMVREQPDAPAIRGPADVAKVLPEAGSLAQEAFMVLTLNTRNKLINKHLITLGLLDASLVHAREVFRPAILDGAAAVILAHNHPGGDPTPSAEDLRVTKQLHEAGAIIDIKVLDHVIIGHGATPYTSLREAGLIN